MRKRLIRRDVKHFEIVSELKRAGFTLVDLSMIGCDVPDLLIARNGFECLTEIKTKHLKSDTAETRLSDGQREFGQTWRGPRVIYALDTESIITEFDRRFFK